MSTQRNDEWKSGEKGLVARSLHKNRMLVRCFASLGGAALGKLMDGKLRWLKLAGWLASTYRCTFPSKLAREASKVALKVAAGATPPGH